MNFDRFVVLSGASGGGKSSVLEALHGRGFATVAEPGRRIVQDELARGGAALPWVDLAAFAQRAIDLALADRTANSGATAWVFFDRGLIDAAAALEYATGAPSIAALGGAHRYHPRVFFTPPWPEIYVTEPERRHGLAEAIQEYERLVFAYDALGYERHALPKASVEERADFILRALER